MFSIKEIAFVDDTFTIRSQRIPKIFDILDKEKISVAWTCMSRVNTVDKEILTYMKKKGCWCISFGIESGDSDVLKVIKKNIDLEQVKNVIKWCDELKIRTRGFFIVGHPSDNETTIKKTIDFACSLNLSEVITTINTPIPGSEQYKEYKKYGTLNDTDWKEFNYWRPVFVPFGLTEEKLLYYHKMFYRRFYMRPKIIFSTLLSFFSVGGIKRAKNILKSLPFLLREKK